MASNLMHVLYIRGSRPIGTATENTSILCNYSILFSGAINLSQLNFRQFNDYNSHESGFGGGNCSYSLRKLRAAQIFSEVDG